MGKLTCILVLLLSFSQCVHAQNDTLNPYFISYEQKIVTGISFQNNTYSLKISEMINGDRVNFNFYPNIKQKINIGVSYKLIDFSIGFTPKFLHTSNSKYKSNNFNFSTRFNHKKWYQSINIAYQKGLIVAINDRSDYYLPAFRSTRIGGTTSYVFNDNFSFSALFNQKQWQTRSAGSFIPNFSAYYTSLVNKKDKHNFNIELYSLSLTPSYYYTYVVNQKVFFSGGLGIGAGVDINKQKVALLGEFIANAKLGYNTNKFYSYVEVNSINFIFNEQSTQFNNSFVDTRITVGFRFDPPKIVKNTYNKELKKVNNELKKI